MFAPNEPFWFYKIFRTSVYVSTITKPHFKEERFTPRLQPKCFYIIYAENGNFVDVEYESHVARSQVFDRDLPVLFAYFSHHFPYLLQLDVISFFISS